MDGGDDGLRQQIGQRQPGASRAGHAQPALCASQKISDTGTTNERGGARIIIIEKDDAVSYANCGMPYYIGGEIPNRSDLAVATPKMLWDRFRIETWLEHEVQNIDPSSRTVSGMATGKGEPFSVG